MLVEKMDKVTTTGFTKKQLVELFLKWMEKPTVKTIVIDAQTSSVHYFEELP